MTKTNSLIEDMARAMAMSDTIESRHPSSMCPDYRNLAAVALQTLKDRLPADDRELVERLRLRLSGLSATAIEKLSPD